MDGNGIAPIDDRDLAQKLLQKVNEMNDYIGASSLLGCLIFAALPQDVVAKVAAFGVLLAGFYFVSDKLPAEP